MKYPQEIIERIRDRADIVEVIGEDVDLKQKGSNFSGFSPFNDEKTPSFVVSPQKRIYKDFSSGRSGNVFTWLMEFHGMSFIEAVRSLAKKYGITLPDITSQEETHKYAKEEMAFKAARAAAEYFIKKLHERDGKVALSYFIKRGFTDDTIKAFMLGYAPDSWNALSDELIKQGFSEENLLDAGLIIKRDDRGFYDRFRGRAIFTIRDFLGKPIGFGARQLIDDKNSPKYINSPQTIIYDKSKVLYGLAEGKNAIRNKGEAILVEGYADVITLYQAGIENVVASSGTALTEQQIKLLKRYSKKLFIIYDSDKAGVSAAEKGVEIALANALEPLIVRLPEGEDPDSLVKESGSKALHFFLKDAVNFVDFKVTNRRKSSTLATPGEKADLVREIAKVVATIPDKLQHHFYLRRAATLLDLSESQLEHVYKEKSEYSVAENKQTVPVRELKKENRGTLIREETKSFEEVTIGETLHKIPLYVANEVKKEELIILKILVTRDNPLFLIESKYDLVHDDFETELGRQLFSKIYEIAHDHDDVFDTVIAGEGLDPTERDILSSIALPIFEISKKWEDMSQNSDINPEQLMEDAVQRLRLSKMKRELHEINESMRGNPGSVSSDLLRRQLELQNKITAFSIKNTPEESASE